MALAAAAAAAAAAVFASVSAASLELSGKAAGQHRASGGKSS